MKYTIKRAKVDELKDGRTFKYISQKIGCTPEYIGSIFSGYRNCGKTTAFALVALRGINNSGMSNYDEMIDYYFDKIEE